MLQLRFFYWVSQIIAITIVILTVLWTIIYVGVVWDITDELIYNWHPIFMVLGMVFFYGNSILIFRAFRTASKRKVKILHAVFHAAAIAFITMGLAVEFISHYYHEHADLYTLHSWVGIATVGIFGSQFIFGFVCYVIPMNERFKALYLPIHVFFGTVCFVMAITTCLIGLNELAFFRITSNDLPPEGVLINSVGVLIFTYGLLVVYLVTRSSFKRPSDLINSKTINSHL